MFSLILIVIIGLGIALFSQQNTQTANVTVGSYVFPSVPVYLVAIVSMLFGLFIAWILSIMNFFSTLFVLRRKDGAISHEQKRADDLEQTVKELRQENAQLKGSVQREKTVRKEPVLKEERPSFVENMKERLAVSDRKEAVT